jgi:sugar transferase EpsL
LGDLLLKRLGDITIATVVLFFSLPIMLVVGLLVRMKLGSPVVFRQVRPGLNGKLFHMYKFRTMSENRNVSGKLLSDEKRLTSFGRMLRAMSLDELPELVNVVKGDMSLVGPRPLLEEYLPLYSEEQFRRHEVRPGITGWAQINGRNALSWQEKFELDVWYVDNRSWWLDVKILSLTIGKIIKKEGINHEGSVTMSKFEG